MRVWIDVSNSPQVPFFRPLIALLEERGHDVDVTTRDYAQTLELLAAARDPRTRSSGRPTAARARSGKARAMAARLPALRRWARRRALRPRALARVARAPARGALARDPVGVRLRLRVRARPARPRLPRRDARRRARGDPAGAARPARARERARCVAIPGSKEEYYLARLRARPGASLDELGLDPERVLVVVRTPPDVSLYHRHENPLFARRAPTGSARIRPCRPSSSRARAEQRAAIAALGLPSLVLPEHAIDAQSLVALADLVVSAGGTMNREAVALGVPVVHDVRGSARRGRRDAHPRRADSESSARRMRCQCAKRGATRRQVDRDPALLLDLMLTAL